MGQRVGRRGIGVIGQGDRRPVTVGVLLDLADVEHRGAGLGGRRDGAVDVDEPSPLAGERLTGVRVPGARRPGDGVGGGVQAPRDLIEGVEAGGVLDLGVRLQDERGGAGRVGRGHRGAGLGPVGSVMVERPGGPDSSARGDDVGLELEGVVQTPAGEARDESAGGLVELGGVLPVGQRGVGVQGSADGVAVGLGDARHRDRDRVTVAADGEGRDRAGLVVVDDDAGGAAGLGVEGLVAEGAGTASDQHGPAGVGAGRGGGAQHGGVGRLIPAIGGRVPGGHQRGPSPVVTRDRGGAARDLRVEVLLAGVGGDRQIEIGLDGVVDAADRQDVLGGSGSAHGPPAVLALVALSGRDDHALGGEVLGGDGGRVVPEDDEVGADGHVDDVHAVVGGALHGTGQNLTGGAARAAEDAVGAELGVGGDAGDLVGAGSPFGGGDAGDMGAVAPAVVGVVVRGGRQARRRVGGRVAEGVADEVVTGHHLRIGEVRGTVALGGLGTRSAGAAEFDVVVVDARIDDPDLDPLAGVAELGLGDVGAGHAQGVAHLRRGDLLLALLALLDGRLARVVRVGAAGRVGIRGRDVDDGLKRDDLGQSGEGLDVGVAADGDGHAVPQRPVLRGDSGVDAGVPDRAGEVVLLGSDGVGGTACGDGGRGQLDEPAVLDGVGLSAVGQRRAGGDFGGRIAGGGLRLAGGGGRGRGDEGSECQGRGTRRDDAAKRGEVTHDSSS